MKNQFLNTTLNITLGDQSLVSATNFFVGIILARYLGVEEFGIFSLLWMMILFIQSIQMAAIISPMMSIGPILDESDQHDYYQALTSQQIIYSFISSFFLYLSLFFLSILFPDWHLMDYALPLSVTAFLTQNQDFIRRILFIDGKVSTAFFLDVLAYGLRLLILIFIFRNDYLSIVNTLWSISAALCVSLAFGVKNLYIPSINQSVIINAHRRNWHTSKWLVGSAIMLWASGNYFIVTAGIILGPISVGIIKAVGNLIGLTNIIFLGLENIAPSGASRAMRVSGISGLYSYLINLLLYGGIVILLILVFLSTFSEPLIKLIYGNDYSGNGYILIWYCSCTLIQFINFPFLIGLRSLEHTKPIFISYIITTLFSLASAHILVSKFNMHGVMLGMLINNIIMLFISYYYFIKSHKLHDFKNQTRS
ncbi:lipopolysaccharide biosynthesis protein [Gammaproteobacteria bacterium]|nr:lipopolysaccharide biosynthesis protein [Gammaproteobacteria bacterium]